MLLKRPLDDILGQSSKVKILRFLINSQAQLNGREIAKAISLSHVNAHAALKSLCRHGLVNRRSVGRSIIYWLNEEHFLVKNILRPIFEKEAEIFQELSQVILKKSKSPPPLSIILFGSFAKNNASPDSDIDVVIVYPEHKNNSLIKKELFGAQRQIALLFGNHLAGIPMKVGEFQKRFRRNENFVREVSKTGVIIYGKGIAQLINLNVKKD